MDLKNIIFEKEDRIGFITLDHSKVYNALNHALLTDLGELIEKIRMDSETGVVIVTGAGEKAFVPGADISEIPSSTSILGWETS